jgi:hypothetical protein
MYRMKRMTAILISGVLLNTANVYADSITDGFDTGISSLYWTQHTPGGSSSIVGSGGEVLMTQGNDAGGILGAYLEFKYLLTGDFDARIDYRLINWPVNNQERIGIILAAPDGVSAIAAVERISDDGFVAGNEGYLTHFLNGTISVPTTDTAGTLRLTRTGDTVAGYYWSGSGWSLVNSYSSALNNPGPSPLYLPIWWQAAPTVGVQIAFDNFFLDAPGTTIPQVPVPAAIWLLGSGLIGLGGFARHGSSAVQRVR